MALDDEAAMSANHSVVHSEFVTADTNGWSIRDFPIISEPDTVSEFPFIQIEIHVLDGNNSQPTRCAFLCSKINSCLGLLR